MRVDEEFTKLVVNSRYDMVQEEEPCHNGRLMAPCMAQPMPSQFDVCEWVKHFECLVDQKTV